MPERRSRCPGPASSSSDHVFWGLPRLLLVPRHAQEGALQGQSSGCSSSGCRSHEVLPGFTGKGDLAPQNLKLLRANCQTCSPFPQRTPTGWDARPQHSSLQPSAPIPAPACASTSPSKAPRAPPPFPSCPAPSVLPQHPAPRRPAPCQPLPRTLTFSFFLFLVVVTEPRPSPGRSQQRQGRCHGRSSAPASCR